MHIGRLTIKKALTIKNLNAKRLRIKAMIGSSFNSISVSEKFFFEIRDKCNRLTYRENKKALLKFILHDLHLVLFSFGIGNISKRIWREARIKKH